MTTLATVTFSKQSGIPADEVQNSFVFNQSGAPTSADYNNQYTALVDFYNGSGSGGTIAEYISADIVRSGALAPVIKQYDITGLLHADDDHGSPVAEGTFALGAAGGTAIQLPPELAICLSFHADQTGFAEETGTTRPRARRRGRVYLGPFMVNAISRESNEEFVASSSVRAAIAAAATRLRDDANTIWAVWSRANASSSPVTGGFVDNAWDVQRRRGVRATARTTF